MRKTQRYRPGERWERFIKQQRTEKEEILENGKRVYLTGNENYPYTWKVIVADKDPYSIIATFESREQCRKWVINEIDKRRKDLGRIMEKWNRRDEETGLERLVNGSRQEQSSPEVAAPRGTENCSTLEPESTTIRPPVINQNEPVLPQGFSS